jgi:hypothetical protein
MARILSSVKQRLISKEMAPRTIAAGAFRGIRMYLNLAAQTQLCIGLYERETYPWLRRLSKEIATAIDIGAAHGEYTLFFLKRTNASKVYAFEPDPIAMSHLKSNLALNRNIRPERLTLYTEFVAGPDSPNVFCLDSLAKNIRYPCFIKMDVDGSEAKVLSGARGLNAHPDVRWLIETHSSELEKDCVIRLELSGFKTKIIRNAFWRFIIPEERPGEHNRWLVGWK